MTDCEFSELYSIGDFVFHRNMICVVERFELEKKSLFNEEAENVYIVKPIFVERFLDKEFRIKNKSIVCKRVATDKDIIEHFSLILNSNFDIDDETSIIVSDDSLMILQSDEMVSLSPSQAISLRNIINEFVQE